MAKTELTLGAIYLGDRRTRFRVWAPLVEQVEVHLDPPGGRYVALGRADNGYFESIVDGVAPGTEYLLRLDGKEEYPDPASRAQPSGIHGPSGVMSDDFTWSDDSWSIAPIGDLVIYEVHVGTFTDEGSFEAILPRLEYLRELGVNALELMPIAQFPGGRNWGYDGAYPYAAQDSYGGVEGLRRLVDACHAAGIAVILDVVYNHLGPEGSHLPRFGPYVSQEYRTAWGASLNFDGRDSDEVRRYFIENAIYWARTCHIDAFRLDAVDAIVDPSAYPFLEELTDAVHEEAEAQGRAIYVMSESSLNDPKMVRTKDRGGWGMDAVWCDEFHHAVHSVLTGESVGYYMDFGKIEQLEKSFREALVYTGEYSPFRRHKLGRPATHVPPERFVVSVQNHDQVGNRVLGERFGRLLPFEAQKLAGALLLLSPFVPLIFMGEEYGETAPFQYFVSHTDPDLIEAVQQGRREGLAALAFEGDAPDPQDERTFLACKIDPSRASVGNHRAIFEMYKTLLRLRGTVDAFTNPAFDRQEVSRPVEAVITLRRWSPDGRAEAIAAFNVSDDEVPISLSLPDGTWRLQFDTAALAFQGPGSLAPVELQGGSAVVRLPPYSAALYERTT